MNSKKFNMVFLGNFPFPCGMAGSKRVRNTICALQNSVDISASVLTLRGSSQLNGRSGIDNGIPYQIILPDVFRLKAILLLPFLWIMSVIKLFQVKKKTDNNILYVYGPPNIDNIVPVLAAKISGWKIVYDIVEDEHAAFGNSKSTFHKFGTLLNGFLTNRLCFIADGIVVISSHLERKFSKPGVKKRPIHLLPISIDTSRFICSASAYSADSTLFYAGSYGTKDGVENLIAAFNELTCSYEGLSLVLAGKGSEERMKVIKEHIRKSPARDHIHYKGYLRDDEYFELLCNIDIPCMTRIDSAYANAGFPFKLGEYLATGKAVIASDVSDVGRYLVDKQNAILVKPGCVAEIVAAVHFLLGNQDTAQQIGRQGKITAERLFDLRHQGKSLAAFLQTVVTGDCS